MKSLLNKIFSLFILSCSLQVSIAQSDIPVLTWRSHLSYNSIIDITQSQDRVYAATPNALFYVDLDDGSINKITKNDGLSDVGIGAIEYDSDLGVLIVGYSNGNIDLIYEDRILNISTIKEADLIGEKQFSDIKARQGLIYMANALGIFVINPDRAEILESYRNLSSVGTTLMVNEIEFSQDSIYATTPSGILSASLDNGTNRQDFNNWQRALTHNSFNNIISINSDLTASAENILYQFSGNNWVPTSTPFASTILDLNSFDNTLNVLISSGIFEVNNNSQTQVTSLENDTNPSTLSQNNSGFWIGTNNTGLINFEAGAFQNFSPSGPQSDMIWRLKSDPSGMINLSGGHSNLVQALQNPGVISRFLENSWSTQEVNSNGINIPDLVDVEFVENSSSEVQRFAASFTHGLVDLSTNTIIDDNTTGSTLDRNAGSLNITSIAQEDQSLWITTYDFDNSLHKWDLINDTWESFSFGTTQSRYPLDLLITPNGDKWLALDANRGGGLVVFNEASNISRHLNTNGGQGGLPGREVTSMVLDQDFFLWIGTNAGIAFYPNVRTVLDGQSLSASIPIFENSFLLRNEFITSIEIDPGNRKWIGTATNGIWLFSETGEELVYHFTTENSPLLSDRIEEIEINPKTGEVFIGTANGLVSFRSDAVEGGFQHNNVKVFPNPVTRDFTGAVTISGLANSATVKITDASGKLVREIRAQGSSAIWDANDYNGRRVQTGVYLVFSSNSDGTETYVSKIAVI